MGAPNLPILAAATGMFLETVAQASAPDSGLVADALTQYGPLGLFCVALWLMVRGKDAEMRELRGELKEMHAQAVETVAKVTSAVERNTAEQAAVREELSEVSAKLDVLAEQYAHLGSAPSERSRR